jgi:hypothetical protein
MTKKLFLLLLFLNGLTLDAQDSVQPQMADTMRSDGKILVVISVIAIIFVSIVLYLIMLDRKIRRIEEKLKK